MKENISAKLALFEKKNQRMKENYEITSVNEIMETILQLWYDKKVVPFVFNYIPSFWTILKIQHRSSFEKVW